MDGFIRKLIAPVCALVLAAFISMPVSAANNEWTKLGPEGGFVYDMVYHRTTPSTIYVLARSGFYRSTDSGATWQLATLPMYPFPTQMSVDRSNPDRIYFATYLRPHVSTDRGATFKELPSPAGGVRILEVSGDGTTLYAVNDNSMILRSTDQGQTWQQRGPMSVTPLPVSVLAVDPTNAGTLYALTIQDGIYASTDGGLGWVRRGLGSLTDLQFATRLIIDPQTPARMWVLSYSKILFSADSGDTWTTVYTATDALKDGPTGITLSPSDPALVYATFADGKIRSTHDQGAHWDIAGDRKELTSAIAVSPVQSTSFLVASVSVLAAGSTTATTWNPRGAGLVATAANSLVAADNADRIYFTSDAGVFYVENGVVSPVNNAALKQANPSTITPVVLHVQPGAAGALYVATGDIRLTKSNDGGSTWTALPNPPYQITTMAGSRSDSQVLYAGTYLGVMKSADGGSHWTLSNTGLPQYDPPPAQYSGKSNIAALAAGSDAALVYAGTSGAGVYKTTNGGQSWVQANTGIIDKMVYDIAVDPSNDQIVFAATGDSIWKSTNGGGSWSIITTPLTIAGEYYYGVDIDPSAPRIVFANTSNRVLRSIDGGASWQELGVAQGFKYWGIGSMLVDPRRPQSLLIGTMTDGVQQFSPASDLSVSMTAPSALTNGVAASYTINAQNMGPWDVTNARIIVQVPSNASAITATSSVATCSTSANTVTCTISAMRRNTVAPITVSVTPSAAGSFQVSAQIASTQGDVATTNNSVSDTTSVAEPAAVVGVGNNGGGSGTGGTGTGGTGTGGTGTGGTGTGGTGTGGTGSGGTGTGGTAGSGGSGTGSTNNGTSNTGPNTSAATTSSSDSGGGGGQTSIPLLFALASVWLLRRTGGRFMLRLPGAS